ncbi:MAG: hypothetical protein IAB19_05020 [Proteobacteria bacterium]|uniref:HNH nuclease domain-containing protein n=1 Tax=Candidatus Avisuccinivibrio stercorigallinarum TaxID=2840704 RepID=A0A9D9D9S2_9GAMM|nr:hypothetical protein [Candidatus Avisuccinivibrio stercorigallinarum]
MRICYSLPGNRDLQDNPKLAEIAIDCLSRCFNKKNTSYKFFWFWALLELYGERCAERDAKEKALKEDKKKDSQYNLKESIADRLIAGPDGQPLQSGSTVFLPLQPIYFYQMAAKMIAIAWYPYNRFKLHFGSTDQIAKVIENLLSSPEFFIKKKLKPLSSDSTEQKVYTALTKAAEKDSDFRADFEEQLCKYVPMRFLSPWFPDVTDKKYPGKKEAEIQKRCTQNQLCLYQTKSSPNGEMLEINAVWSNYLREHQGILTDFTLLHLVKYLEKCNPTVPNIVNKLKDPRHRSSLNYAKDYFQTYFEQIDSTINIYNKEQILEKKDFEIDHFIPWSFIGHDELWNLAPIDKITNIQKSDKLPNLDIFLEPLAKLHFEALQHNQHFLLKAEGKDDGLKLALPEDVSMKSIQLASESLKDGLRKDLKELLAMNEREFCGLIDNTIRPIYQQACNLHFQTWNAVQNSISLQSAT